MRIIGLALGVIVLIIGCSQFNREYKCTVEGNHCGRENETEDTGSRGEQGDRGPEGQVGQAGPAGEPGEQGEKGDSCSVDSLSNGAIITCEDGTTAVIYNGVDGLDGQDGADGEDGEDGEDAPPTAYTITEIIDPCGDQSGFDEVILRTANEELLAHFASGSLQYLTLLPPGSYVTTDGHSCYFTVHSDMSVTW